VSTHLTPEQQVRWHDAYRGWRFGRVESVTRTGKVRIRHRRRLIVVAAEKVREIGGKQ
jgi:hypothetical protein